MKSLSNDLFEKQISKLVISILPLPNTQQYKTIEYLINHIFVVFKKLTHLIFTESSYSNIVELRCDPPMKFCSSTLLPTDFYDKLILPFLYQMSNLERLNLSISVEKIFIDRLNLTNDIINHFLRLNQFTFDIHSIMTINNEIILPTEEDFPNRQILSYIDHFPYLNQSQYHIYTYPSQMSFHPNISNQYPGGYYPTVRLISLYDEKPFEHEFFLRISQLFPCVEKLILCNRQPQKYKQSSKLIVQYFHLIELDIVDIYFDYIEEFLCDTRTFFRNNIRLRINDSALIHETDYFRREDTRMNCSKVNDFISYGPWRSWKSFQEYFPSLKHNFSIPSFYLV
ncbi:hypothetical protein I4U23_017335 [Adineta vaga]|nr:hypothetical protein I4U23_017335 [Adineta vaga]